MIETASIRGECSLDAAAFQHIYNFYLIDTVSLTYYIPWGMAAFRENARLIVRRLGRVGDARASATIRNSESTHRRLRRVYENAAEHYRCVTTSGKHGRRH